MRPRNIKMDSSRINYLEEILNKIYGNANLSDFTLVAGIDGRRFSAHKNIMAAASGFFATMFESNFSDSKNKEYVVQNMDGASLKKIVHCCHTGQITIDDKCVYDIIKVANYLQLLYIEKKCFEHLTRSLRIDNCVSHHNIADSLNLSNLKTKSIEMISKDFAGIGANQLQQMEAKLLIDVLKSAKIEAPEETVFSQLKEWVEGNIKDRSKHVQSLIGYIQLERISGKFLLDQVKVFCEKFKCDQKVKNECRKRIIEKPITFFRQRHNANPYKIFDAANRSLNKKNSQEFLVITQR